MMVLIPISTFFLGCHGLLALFLSYLVAMERTRTRIWHGASPGEVASQPNYLDRPNAWAQFVEKITQQFIVAKNMEDGALQRTMRAYGNFTEYVPLGLMFLIALELMQAERGMLWMLGTLLIVARIAHAWGLIQTYGPSPGRAIGFFGTWVVYVVGSMACIYYSVQKF
ncbi:MAPEG family protein [Nostoc linckia FACHB-104]|nr:MAPEG family protein [Nostoc linckia FACHB-104]